MTFAVALVLAASPLVAVTGLTGANVSASSLPVYTQHLAHELSVRGVRVVTAAEIASLLGYERQKELLGCSDADRGSCMAELGNALGAQAILSGTLGHFAEVFQIDLQILASQNGARLASYSARVEGGEKDVLVAMEAAAQALAEQLGVARPVPKAQTSRWIKVAVPSVLGAGALVAGVLLRAAAVSELGPIAHPAAPLPAAQIEQHARSARRDEVLSDVAFGLAAAGAATAITFALWRDHPASVAFGVGPGGASLAGTF